MWLLAVQWSRCRGNAAISTMIVSCLGRNDTAPNTERRWRFHTRFAQFQDWAPFVEDIEENRGWCSFAYEWEFWLCCADWSLLSWDAKNFKWILCNEDNIYGGSLMVTGELSHTDQQYNIITGDLIGHICFTTKQHGTLQCDNRMEQEICKQTWDRTNRWRPPPHRNWPTRQRRDEAPLEWGHLASTVPNLSTGWTMLVT